MGAFSRVLRAKTRPGLGGGRLGRLSAGVAVARWWSGQGGLGWFWTLGSLSAGELNTRNRELQPAPNSPEPRLGPGMGAPPPRVAALGPRGSGQAQGALLLRRERSPGAGDPTCRPTRHGIPLTQPAGPGRPRAWFCPGRGAPGLSKGPPCPGCWVLAPGALLSS